MTIAKYLRTIIMTAIVMLVVGDIYAQSIDTDSISAVIPPNIVDSIQQSGNIHINQPIALADKLHNNTSSLNNTDSAQPTATRSGYRIQVFEDNTTGSARTKAEAMAEQMRSSFTEWRVYVAFASPFWRVKVGDFRSYGEAREAMEKVRELKPSLSGYMRIVRDKVNIVD